MHLGLVLEQFFELRSHVGAQSLLDVLLQRGLHLLFDSQVLVGKGVLRVKHLFVPMGLHLADAVHIVLIDHVIMKFLALNGG